MLSVFMILLPVTSNLGLGQARAAMLSPQTATFSCLGIPQYFVVPPGVTEITVDATGSAGNTKFGSNFSGGDPGHGGSVHTTLVVTPGDTLTITVGCMSGYGYSRGGLGGPNGSGNTDGSGVGTNGGGSTGIVNANASTPLLVAGGGGGGGGDGAFLNELGGAGGSGGGSSGSNGTGAGSGAGGSGGGAPVPHGRDGDSPATGSGAGAGGGGGGGFPLGGAGGSGGAVGGGGGGGGGGGQSFADSSIASDVAFGVADTAQDGQVTFSYTGPDGTPQTYVCSAGKTDYTVPDGVIGLLVTAVGADGGASVYSGILGDSPSAGAKAGLSGTLTVEAGQVLQIGAGCAGEAPDLS
jgi:hypothetical protein